MVLVPVVLTDMGAEEEGCVVERVAKESIQVVDEEIYGETFDGLASVVEDYLWIKTH